MGARGRDAGAIRGAGLNARGRRLLTAAALLALASSVFAAAAIGAADPGDPALFLRPRGFFLGPGATITLPIVDGAFDRSARGVPRARLREASILGPWGRRPLDHGTWTARDPRSTVRVTVGDPGTYVVGIAVGAGQAGAGGRATSAKTLLAVTDAAGHLLPAAALRAESAATRALGHDLEIVPLVDPYALGVGDTLPVQVRAAGRPLARWPVRAGGSIGTSAAPIPAQALTTTADGRVEIRLTHDGHWFVAVAGAPGPTAPARGAPPAEAATLTFGLLPAGTR